MQGKENDTADRELTISRLLDAPVHLVWEVWTNPNHIKNWWGPTGFTNTIQQMDVKPEGAWVLTMHGPDGKDYKNRSVFIEVIKHKKLMYEHVTSPHFIATIKFEAQGSKTFLHWHMLFDTMDQFLQVVKVFKADEGLKQNVEKLTAYLAGPSFNHFLKKSSAIRDNVVITRIINAPKELVFQAFTDKEMMAQWWGPHGFANSDCDKDVRPSGHWRILMDSPEFPNLWCKGIFIEIAPPHRLVFTTRGLIDDSDQAGLESLNTLLLEDENGRTKLTMSIEVTKIKEEAMVAYEWMEEGWSQSFEKLNSLISAQFKIRKQLKTNHMSRVSTYLNFPGTTEEAFNFYKTVFKSEFPEGGLQRFGEITQPEGMPPLSENDKKLILHIELEILGGHIIMATDAPESMGLSVNLGNHMHINLEPDTREETKRLFNALSVGGNVTMELQDMFWGAFYGSCTDRFGINWMLNCNESKK